MQLFNQPITDAKGNAVSGATVRVLVSPGGAAATIYAANGGSPLPTNILTTDANGYAKHYAANGRYYLEVTGPTISGTQVYSDYILFDPADAPSAEFDGNLTGDLTVSGTANFGGAVATQVLAANVITGGGPADDGPHLYAGATYDAALPGPRRSATGVDGYPVFVGLQPGNAFAMSIAPPGGAVGDILLTFSSYFEINPSDVLVTYGPNAAQARGSFSLSGRGGNLVTSTGVGGGTLGGAYNTVSAPYAIAFGRKANARLRGQVAQSAGDADAGPLQTSVYCMGVVSLAGAATSLTLDVDGEDPGGVNRLVLLQSTTWAFEALISGRVVDAGFTLSAAYHVRGCIKNDGGLVAFVGTPVVTVIGEDDASWGVSVAVDNVNDALDILVTGHATEATQWFARVTTAEVAGNFV